MERIGLATIRSPGREYGEQATVAIDTHPTAGSASGLSTADQMLVNLVAELSVTEHESTRRADLRRCAIEAGVPFANRLARRYRHTKEPMDDPGGIKRDGSVRRPSRPCGSVGW
jgi:hypothetical protein